ncbi:MAG TPA: hypothetical protein PKV98_04085 [Burkholderiaceae bacterium]|nr:hypothetical protein [Burkholderiaceae bacterium]
MTPQQLVDTFGLLADDNAEPKLWSDALRLTYASDGELEAARRARLILDTSTTEICQLEVSAVTAAEVADYEPLEVDARVIFVRRVKLDSQDRPLPKASVAELDLNCPGWETEIGTPRAWIPWGDHQIRPYPLPDTDDVMRLHVIREPLEQVALATVSPAVAAVPLEIAPRYHMGVVKWMLHRAYLHRERQDMYRPEESARYLAEFEEEFGKKSTAVDETWINRKHGYDEFEGVY